jgi:hypothetical protein
MEERKSKAKRNQEQPCAEQSEITIQEKSLEEDEI